jgi:hypothetical protein
VNDVYADEAGELHHKQFELGLESAKNQLRYISEDEDQLRRNALMMRSFYDGIVHYINHREEYEGEDSTG